MLCRELFAAPGLRLAEVGREKFPELQSYLAFLKGSLGSRVDNLDLSKVTGLKVVDDRLVIERVDKTAINRAIHETVPPPEPKKQEIPPEVIAGIRALQDGQFRHKIGKLESDINRHISAVQSKNREIMDYFKFVSKASMEIHQLKTGSSDFGLIEFVNKILSDGFWINPRFGSISNSIEFFAKDVWLSFNDLEAKVNKRINMGDFKLQFIFENEGLSVRVYGVGNNISAGRFIHPHLHENIICLGNASTSWAEASKKNDIAAMAHIARLILTTYNPDNPYLSFSHFEEEFKRRQQAAVRMTSEQQIRDEYESSVASGTYNDAADLEWFDELVPNF